MVKNLPANAENMREVDLISGLARYPGEGHGNPLQYSCPEKPMERRAWQAAVHRITKSQTQPKRISTSPQYPTLCLVPNKCLVNIALLNKDE